MSKGARGDDDGSKIGISQRLLPVGYNSASDRYKRCCAVAITESVDGCHARFHSVPLRGSIDPRSHFEPRGYDRACNRHVIFRGSDADRRVAARS